MCLNRVNRTFTQTSSTHSPTKPVSQKMETTANFLYFRWYHDSNDHPSYLWPSTKEILHSMLGKTHDVIFSEKGHVPWWGVGAADLALSLVSCLSTIRVVGLARFTCPLAPSYQNTVGMSVWIPVTIKTSVLIKAVEIAIACHNYKIYGMIGK